MIWPPSSDCGASGSILETDATLSMTLSLRSLRWAPVAMVLLVVISSGAWVASRRIVAEEARLASDLTSQVGELARSVDPGLLGQLTLTPSDPDTAAHRRLSDLVAAYDLVNPEQLVFLLALRDGELRLGPTSRPMVDSADASAPGGVLDTAQYRAMERAGEATIYGAGRKDASEMITALAPVISPASGMIVGAVGMKVPASAWRGEITRAALPPIVGALAAAAILLVCYVLTAWRAIQPPEVIEHWRHMETVFTAVASIFITGVVTLYIVRVESRQRDALFTAVAKTRVSSVQAELSEAQSDLTALSRFFESSTYVSREEFSAFVGPASAGGIVAYEWVPAGECPRHTDL